MVKTLSKPKPFNVEYIDKLPAQSGVYVLWRKGERKPYIGMAGAGNLRKRVRQHFMEKDKRCVNKFSVLPTQSTKEARKEENQLRNKLNPEQKI